MQFVNNQHIGGGNNEAPHEEVAEKAEICTQREGVENESLQQGESFGGNVTLRQLLDQIREATKDLWREKSGRCPRIFNTDQGSQYTSEDRQSAIRAEGIQIRMDGKGRWADNIVMERFWRICKHEFCLQRGPMSLGDAMEMTTEWLEYYNEEWSHSALGCRMI